MKRTITTTLFSALLALLAGCATHQHSNGDRYTDWRRWEKSSGGNGHWYKAVLVTNGITWPQSAAAARAEGGYLATLTSDAENQFVFELVNKPDFFAAANGLGPFLGASQPPGSQEPRGGWQWVTGEPWGHYTNWRRNQPDNAYGDDKLQFFSDKSREPSSAWGDVAADWKSMGYVVEREVRPK